MEGACVMAFPQTPCLETQELASNGGIMTAMQKSFNWIHKQAYSGRGNLQENFGWQSPLVSQDAGILGPFGSAEIYIEKQEKV